jgi:hypothetical protein
VLAEVTSDEHIGDIIWSGTGMTKQYITYQIKSSLKGNINSGAITVAHVLLRNSLTVDKEKPRLSPKLFQKGKPLLLFINVGQRIVKGEQGNYFLENEFIVADENCAAMVPDSRLLQRVRNAVPK